MNEVYRHHDLDEIKPTKLLQTRMQKRIKKKKLPPNTILDWKKMMVSILVASGNGGE